MAIDIGQLTSAIAAGDPAAFSVLYRQRFDEVYAHARRATRRDESFCLDITQDVFMRVIKSMKPMESEAQLSGWLHRVTLTAAYDRLRRERAWNRRHERLVQSAPMTGDVPPTGASPVSASGPLEDSERLAWLRQQLSELDEPALFLLEARHRFGWTLARIGELLGVKPGAVDGRIARITQAMQRRTAETPDE